MRFLGRTSPDRMFAQTRVQE